MSVYDSNHKAMASTFMGLPESFYCQQQLNWTLKQWQSTGRHSSTTKVNFCTGLCSSWRQPHFSQPGVEYSPIYTCSCCQDQWILNWPFAHNAPLTHLSIWLPQLSRLLPAGMVMDMQHFVLSQCSYLGTHSLIVR